MKKRNQFRYFKTSPEIIRFAVMLYIRFPLAAERRVLLHERGIEISHQSVRFWWNRIGLIFAAEIAVGALRTCVSSSIGNGTSTKCS